MKFLSVLGARPQFVKASPLSREVRRHHEEVIVHTGQHYDYDMSDIFFEDLALPPPDYHLGVGSGSHGAQTGAMLPAVEAVLQKETPDAVIVYGDTNSTLAGALAAAKLGIPVAHVEAGLRSFNRSMPEEINRIVADHLSTWLFAPSEASREQLGKEGIRAGVYVVGDIMLDALRLHGERATARSGILQQLGLRAGEYFLATVHRAENTDNPRNLSDIFEAFSTLDKPVVLPLHPRTKKMLSDFDISVGGNVLLLEPRGYLEMLGLERSAACILTDSGGIQKEAYYLRVPCVTLRSETEWVETVATGWNVLAGSSPARILGAVKGRRSEGAAHPDLYGDGTAAQQILRILLAGASDTGRDR